MPRVWAAEHLTRAHMHLLRIRHAGLGFRIGSIVHPRNSKSILNHYYLLFRPAKVRISEHKNERKNIFFHFVERKYLRQSQRYEKFPSFRLFSSLIYVSLNVKIYNFQSHNQIIKIPTTLLQLGSIFITPLSSSIFPLTSSLLHHTSSTGASP